MKVQVLIIFISVILPIMSTAQSDSRDIVNATDIMKEIQNGTLVHYENKTIKGNLSIAEINLSKYHEERDAYMKERGLSEQISEIHSEIKFFNCSITDDIDFSNAIFYQPVSINGSKLLARANFRGSIFRQNADFYMTQFMQAANFWGTQFKGWADFTSTQFNDVGDFGLAEFSNVYFKYAEFKKDAIFDWASFYLADFNRTIVLGDLSLRDISIENLNLTKADIKEITLLSWNDSSNLEYDPTAYQLLISNFKNRNQIEDANKCYYDYRNARRAMLPWTSWFADLPLDWLYGYGVRPARTIISSLIFIAFFAILFAGLKGIMPVREGKTEEDTKCFTLSEAAAFSAMTFLSGGKLVFDPPEYKIAPGKPLRDVQICRVLFACERLMGMILIIMFGIAVTKTIILS